MIGLCNYPWHKRPELLLGNKNVVIQKVLLATQYAVYNDGALRYFKIQYMSAIQLTVALWCPFWHARCKGVELW